MTDERLLARLRGRGNKDAIAAADRIESLTAKVKLMDDLDVINGEKIEALTAKLAEAEAKLAKAMEGLREIAGECGCSTARAIIAEIEGEKE
jgi:guanylate kinase